LPGSPTGEQAGHEDKNDCQPFEYEARVHRPFRSRGLHQYHSPLEINVDPR
jgi:hypothetical protein